MTANDSTPATGQDSIGVEFDEDDVEELIEHLQFIREGHMQAAANVGSI